MFLVMHSTNSKVGDVAATYAPIRQTCPTTCKLRDNGCYAQSGNVGFQVRRLERDTEGQNGDTIAILEGDDIADSARHAPANHALRIHVSGDALSDFRAQQLARGARVWKGPVWSYTHAWRDVSRESWGPISVLASCETVSDVVAARAKGYAAALVVAEHPANGRAFNVDDTKLIPCPSQTRDIKCTDCKLCWKADMLLQQNACITFAAHGTSKKRTLTILREH